MLIDRRIDHLHILKKGAPRQLNIESSANWLKCKDQPRTENGQLTSPNKSAGKRMDLDLSMVLEDADFQCYNTAEGKPVHTNLDDEFQLLPKETTLTPETGMKTEKQSY